jgi:hypothetical protein
VHHWLSKSPYEYTSDLEVFLTTLHMYVSVKLGNEVKDALRLFVAWYLFELHGLGTTVTTGPDLWEWLSESLVFGVMK